MLCFASYRFSLCLPESITYTTSSMVTDVSAMFVDSTTFRRPLGGLLKTASCSTLDTDECSLWQETTLASRRSDVISSYSALISCMPGRNTRIAPSPACSRLPQQISRISSAMSSLLILSSDIRSSTSSTAGGAFGKRADRVSHLYWKSLSFFCSSLSLNFAAVVPPPSWSRTDRYLSDVLYGESSSSL
eukprot:gene9510-biopygen9512